MQALEKVALELVLDVGQANRSQVHHEEVLVHRYAVRREMGLMSMVVEEWALRAQEAQAWQSVLEQAVHRIMYLRVGVVLDHPE